MLPVDNVWVVVDDSSSADGFLADGMLITSTIDIGEAFLLVLDSVDERPKVPIDLRSAGYTKVFENIYFPTKCSAAVRATLVRSLFSFIEKSYESYVDHARNVGCYEMLFDLASSRAANAPRDILDFGCGTGLIMSTRVPRVVGRLVGYDFSEPMRRNAESRGMSVIESLDKEVGEQFDVILASFVLHLGIDSTTLVKLINLLRRGGVFVANFHKEMFLEETIEEIRRHADKRVTIDLTPTTYGTAMIAQRTP
jgi:SAM-dependent methyltransferase